jgi:hypothetical protein
MALWSGIRADDTTVREVHLINKFAFWLCLSRFRFHSVLILGWICGGCADVGLHRGQWPWLGLFPAEKLRRDGIKIPTLAKPARMGHPAKSHTPIRGAARLIRIWEIRLTFESENKMQPDAHPNIYDR